MLDMISMAFVMIYLLLRYIFICMCVDVEVTTIIIYNSTLLPTRSPARPRNPSDSGKLIIIMFINSQVPVKGIWGEL